MGAALAAALAGVVLVGLPRAALAQDAPPAIEPVDVDADLGTKRPAASDERTGHITISGNVAVTGPTGGISAELPVSLVAGLGFTGGGVLSVGVSRHAALELFADRSTFSSAFGCGGNCAGNGYSFGLGLSYHLAQGIAFDPWGSFSTGFRSATFKAMSVTGPLLDNRLFEGWDVARIAFGGQFYPIPYVGIGPYIEGDFGTFLRRPAYDPYDPSKDLAQLNPGEQDGPRVYGFFQAGIRITVDPFAKAAPSRAPAPPPPL